MIPTDPERRETLRKAAAYRRQDAAERRAKREGRDRSPRIVAEGAPATVRLSMSQARRKRVLERSAGHCAYPGCVETEGLQIDHIIALELGGREDDENTEALCGTHHKAKTARDVRMIAKARRIRNKLSGRDKKPSRWGWRPRFLAGEM